MDIFNVIEDLFIYESFIFESHLNKVHKRTTPLKEDQRLILHLVNHSVIY